LMMCCEWGAIQVLCGELVGVFSFENSLQIIG
jgi:hypothetical protein